MDQRDQGFENFEAFLRVWSRRDFLKKSGGAAALATFLAGGTDLLAACGGGGNSGQKATTATPVKGGHMVWGAISDIAGLNPLLSNDTSSWSMGNLIFDRLADWDDSGNMIPQIAELPVKVSSDGLTYTWPIRKGVKWSDGQPLTVEDIVWTFSLLYDPKYKSFAFGNRQTTEQYISSVTAPDDHTVVIKTKSVYAPLLNFILRVPIMPKHILGQMTDTQLNTADFNHAPTVASGPFRFVRWDKGAQVVLERNPNYHRGPAHLQNFVFRVTNNPTTALATGEIDFMMFSPTDLAQLQAQSNVTTFNVTAAALYYYFAFNLDPAKRGYKLFGDKNVRQAIYYGIDRKAVGDAIFLKTEVIVDSPIPKTSWAYTPATKTYGYDKARAMRMLDAAGWKMNPSTGIREKAGETFSFDMIVNNSPPARSNLLVAMQQQLKEIGIQLNPKVVTGPTWVQEITTQRAAEATLVALTWGATDPDQSNFLKGEAARQGGYNYMHYQNPQVDQILDQAVATLDRAKRKQLYARVTEIVMDDLPMLPLQMTGILWALNKRVHGFKPGQYTQYINWGFFNQVWVNDGK